MSRGARRTGGAYERSRRSVPHRVRRLRPEKRTVLIVGEGRETEPNYFTGLRDETDVSDRFAVTVKRGKGFSPEHVLNEAIRHMERARGQRAEYDEVWCVMDVEGPAKRASLDAARIRAKQNGVQVCLSNPSFEVWLLSHFERTSASF